MPEVMEAAERGQAEACSPSEEIPDVITQVHHFSCHLFVLLLARARLVQHAARLVHACIQSLLVMLLFASDTAMVWSQGNGQPLHQGCMLSIPTACCQVRML